MTNYSNARIPNDPSVFPEPQAWMTWLEDLEWTWDAEKRERGWKGTGNGRVRYHPTLAKAKKQLSWIGSKSKYHPSPGKFLGDWSVYHWDGERWVEVYYGIAGGDRDDNPLFQRRFSKAEKVDPLKQAVEDSVVASILKAMGRAAS